MDKKTRTNFDNLSAPDDQVQYKAFMDLLKTTDKPVDWAYEVWDGLVADLRHKHPHRRARATQILSNLAKSDPKNRMLKDFDAVFAITRDEKFVVSRHTLQAVWKVALVGKKQQKLVVDRLAGWFAECVSEKNCTLIRYDITQDLRNIYEVVKDEKVKAVALELIETETDAKYKKKYAEVWRKL